MSNRSDELAQQLKAAKEMLRRLEESLAKTQKLIEQTRQILNEADLESGSNGGSGNHKGPT
jgi:phage shock protein A